MAKFSSLMELESQDTELLLAALEASSSAYAPYSGFAVGAAVRTQSGRVIVGANIENAAYGVTTCAEVSALSAANVGAADPIDTIAVVGGKFTLPQDFSQVVTPCGRCRQMIFEASQIGGRDIRVLSANGQLTEIMEATISELLPNAFGPSNLGLNHTWPELQKLLVSAVAEIRTRLVEGEGSREPAPIAKVPRR